MALMKEFRDFAVRGNVVDLAVGVIIGGAFGKIVSSFVNDILMPPLGTMLNNINFADLFINLSDRHAATLAEAQAAGMPVISYGVFVNTIIDFLIQAFVIFIIVKKMNELRPAPPQTPEPAPQKICPFCKSAIDAEATRCPFCTSEQ